MRRAPGRSRLLAGFLLCATVPAPAQVPARGRIEPSAADVAISIGRLSDAEDLLYYAARRAPREPSARGALGLFLAARGRLKVGATLLEEAREFGGDERAINLRLTHIRRWSGDWDKAALLRGGVLTPGERDYVRWLAQHPPTIIGADSSQVPLDPNELQGLGTITFTLGSVQVRADIDPGAEGVVLPSTVEMLREVLTFGYKGDSATAVAHAIMIGGITLSNVPVMVTATPVARIGLDVLWRLTPTFDFAARTLTVRQKPPARDAPGTELPLMLTFPGVSVLAREGEAPVPLGGRAGRTVIRGARWTFDLARGAIVVER